MNARTRGRLGFALAICIIGAVIDMVRPCLAGAYCTGDCDANGSVLSGTSGEWVDCRGIFFGSLPLSECRACDCDEDGTVSDAERIQAEQNAMSGCNVNQCPAATSTPGPSATSTPTRTPALPTSTRTLTRTSLPTSTRTPIMPPPTATAISTPSADPTPTVSPAPCIGDCDASGRVTVNELVVGVNIALERAEVGACEAFDPNRTTTVAVNELVRGVNNLLEGCPGT